MSWFSKWNLNALGQYFSQEVERGKSLNLDLFTSSLMKMCFSGEQLKEKLGLRFGTPGSGIDISVIKHRSGFIICFPNPVHVSLTFHSVFRRGWKKLWKQLVTEISKNVNERPNARKSWTFVLAKQCCLPWDHADGGRGNDLIFSLYFKLPTCYLIASWFSINRSR